MTPSAPLLLIRADASTDIGSGHVMRTLAVAQAWMLAGGRVRYVCHVLPDGLAARLGDEGCGVERWGDPDPGGAEDGLRLRAAAEAEGAAAVVVDGYAFGADFRRALSGAPAATLLVHDYALDGPLWLDFLLNQNPHAGPELYPQVEGPRLLLGLGWALLRREFLEAVRRERGEAEGQGSAPLRLLVTLGGGDPLDLTGRVVRGLDAVERPLEVRAVVGPAYPHGERLARTAAASRHAVRVIRDARDMPALMAWADLAVAAAGSTSWELAWMAVPWLSVAFADNQRPILRALGERDVAVPLGWHEAVEEADVGASVAALAGDAGRRRELSGRAALLLDGSGAPRVAALLRGQG